MRFSPQDLDYYKNNGQQGLAPWGQTDGTIPLSQFQFAHAASTSPHVSLGTSFAPGGPVDQSQAFAHGPSGNGTQAHGSETPPQGGNGGPLGGGPNGNGTQDHGSEVPPPPTPVIPTTHSSADLSSYLTSPTDPFGSASSPYVPAGSQSFGGIGGMPMAQANQMQAPPLTGGTEYDPLNQQRNATAQGAGQPNGPAQAPSERGPQVAQAAGVGMQQIATPDFNVAPPPGQTVHTPAKAGITGSNAGAGDTAEAGGIVNSAMKRLGGTYNYGGTDPASGVDCSAFTQQVLAENGIHTGRDTTAQFADPQGKLIGRGMGDLANARPGDLLFFGDPGGGEHAHVGIYQGNGQMISAANSQRGITTDSVEGWNSSGEPLFGIKRFGSGSAPAASGGGDGSVDLSQFHLDPNEQFIIDHENAQHNTGATNPSSGAFGLGQLNPASGTLQEYAQKLGFDPHTRDPAQQIAMFRRYVQERYGSSQAAADFWRQHNWY